MKNQVTKLPDIKNELSNSEKIQYITKECGHKLNFIHDSIFVQIKNNRTIGVQYGLGLPYGFTFDEALNELYKYVILNQ